MEAAVRLLPLVGALYLAHKASFTCTLRTTRGRSWRGITKDASGIACGTHSIKAHYMHGTESTALQAPAANRQASSLGVKARSTDSPFSQRARGATELGATESHRPWALWPGKQARCPEGLFHSRWRISCPSTGSLTGDIATRYADGPSCLRAIPVFASTIGSFCVVLDAPNRGFYFGWYRSG